MMNQANGVRMVSEPDTARASYLIQLVVRNERNPLNPSTVEIACAPGEAPRISVHAWGLTIDEEADLHHRIEVTVDALKIPCACGLTWLEHDAQSPHAAHSGDCRSFTAASPLSEEHLAR